MEDKKVYGIFATLGASVMGKRSGCETVEGGGRFLLTVVTGLIVTMTFGCGVIEKSIDVGSGAIRGVRYRFSPEHQIEKMELEIKELKGERENLVSRRGEYHNEYLGDISYLERSFSQMAVDSHEELLRSRYEYLEFYNALERSASNEYLIKQLDSKIHRTDRDLLELDHGIWKINRRIEIRELLSRKERDEALRLIEATKIFVEENTAPRENQDTAAIEREIFDRLKRGEDPHF